MIDWCILYSLGSWYFMWNLCYILFEKLWRVFCFLLWIYCLIFLVYLDYFIYMCMMKLYRIKNIVYYIFERILYLNYFSLIFWINLIFLLVLMLFLIVDGFLVYINIVIMIKFVLYFILSLIVENLNEKFCLLCWFFYVFLKIYFLLKFKDYN